MDSSLANAFRPCTEAEAYVQFERAFASQHRDCTWNGLLTREQLGSHARAFDLLIMARPGRGADGPSREGVEHALFDSGRPVLLVADRSGSPAGTIVISWTDTIETARAMTASLPLLQRAAAVRIVSVQKANEPPPQAERAARSLARHGVNVDCSIIPEHESVGRSILELAEKVGADILVKGAYTENRIRRLIFGGATNFILSPSEIPVLLAH